MYSLCKSSPDLTEECFDANPLQYVCPNGASTVSFDGVADSQRALKQPCTLQCAPTFPWHAYFLLRRGDTGHGVNTAVVQVRKRKPEAALHVPQKQWCVRNRGRWRACPCAFPCSPRPCVLVWCGAVRWVVWCVCACVVVCVYPRARTRLDVCLLSFTVFCINWCAFSRHVKRKKEEESERKRGGLTCVPLPALRCCAQAH